MRVLPNNIADHSAPGYSSNSPRLDFQVNFSATGQHYIWVVGQGDSTVDNTVHIGLDGAEVPSAANAGPFGTSFEWKQVNTSGQVLTINVATAGIHTVNVWMAKDGFRLDKLLITKTSSPNPLPLTYVERDSGGTGIVVMDAQAFTDTHWREDTLGNIIKSWVAETSGTFTGCMRAMPNTGEGPSTFPSFDPPILDYRLNVTHPGTHYVWVYGQAPTIDDNTVHLGVDGQMAVANHTNFGTSLVWKKAALTIGSGDHKLCVGMAEDGFRFRKLLVTTDSTMSAPSGAGPTADSLTFIGPTFLGAPNSVQNGGSDPAPSNPNAAVSAQSLVESNVPSHLFPRYARQNLTAPTSFDDLGMKFRDRRHYRAAS